MGATVSTIWFVDSPDPAAILRSIPAPDPDATRALAKQLYPEHDAGEPRPATLADQSTLGPDEVLIGSYPGLSVLCAGPLARPRPTELTERFVQPVAAERTLLVATNPQHAWGGFAAWEATTLRRSFSATRVHIHEDEGLPQSWELAYWSGEHPIVPGPQSLPDPQWLPFDPELFAMAANRHWLGFDYSPGSANDEDAAPTALALCRFVLRPAGDGTPQPEPAPPTTAPAPPTTTQPPSTPLAAASSGGPLRRWLRRRSGGRPG